MSVSLILFYRLLVTLLFLFVLKMQEMSDENSTSETARYEYTWLEWTKNKLPKCIKTMMSKGIFCYVCRGLYFSFSGIWRSGLLLIKDTIMCGPLSVALSNLIFADSV